MTQLATLLFGFYILWLFIEDARRRRDLSPAIWLVFAWVALLGSRPVSTWFDAGGGLGSAGAYDEGNPFERAVYFALIIGGLLVLMRRGVRLRDVIGHNIWLFWFFLYWGISVVWADAPFVALKRWIKDLGNIVMVLVVLTDRRPIEASIAAIARSACLLLPMSVLFIRFIPQLGRTYHAWSGEMLYTGVTTHKSSLGALVMVSLIFLLWDVMKRPADEGPPRPQTSRFAELTLMFFGAWLLMKASSATALSCTVLGAALLVLFRRPAWRRHVLAIEVCAALVGALAWMTSSWRNTMNYFIVDVLHRDLTLTTRTDVWPILLGKVDNVMLGSGFNSFWTGERLAELYGQFGIIQAHNGYLETYLNGGIVGLMLLALVLLSALLSTNRQMAEGHRHANLAFAVVIVMLVHNLTEASFNKTSPLWFAFLLMVVQYRDTRSSEALDTRIDMDEGDRAPPAAFETDGPYLR